MSESSKGELMTNQVIGTTGKLAALWCSSRPVSASMRLRATWPKRTCLMGWTLWDGRRIDMASDTPTSLRAEHA